MGVRETKMEGRTNSAEIDLPPEPLKEKVIKKLPQEIGKPVWSLPFWLKNDWPEEEFHVIELNEQLGVAPVNVTLDHALKEENKPKNRYAVVIPFDHSRVILEKVGEEDHTDYINSNYVQNGKLDRYYIASQGPLPNTFDDFWRMVWEHNSTIILMLTRTIENGKLKCHRYWPEPAEEEKTVYGKIKVEYINEEEDKELSILIRKFKLSNVDETDSERLILQVQYLGWPDHGRPEDTKSIREIVKFVDEQKGDGPVVVHCSAGIGRTGTFCTIHSTLMAFRQHWKKTKKPFPFNIYGTVVDLRQQRTGMVQQPEQYKFCYEAIVDGVKELHYKFPKVDRHGNIKGEQKTTPDELSGNNVETPSEEKSKEDSENLHSTTANGNGAKRKKSKKESFLKEENKPNEEDKTEEKKQKFEEDVNPDKEQKPEPSGETKEQPETKEDKQNGN